jgi:hypothetical protein
MFGSFMLDTLARVVRVVHRGCTSSPTAALDGASGAEEQVFELFSCSAKPARRRSEPGDRL